jgi:2-dehydro-3-deoxygalactonokinase
MIGINWGTSNFRAYRLGKYGVIEDCRVSSSGISSVESKKYHETLLREVGHWIQQGERQILISGMAGSRNGWIEVPYVQTPAKIQDIANGCIRVPLTDMHVFIVPGVMGTDDHGIPEVMRGEEAEIFGAHLDFADAAQVALPGTHTKWVKMQEAAIASFATYMTGDLFSAVRSSTILREFPATSEIQLECFIQGVDRSKTEDALTHLLFGARTLFLKSLLQADAGYSYLSGLLIGYEVRHALEPGRGVHLIGDERLCSLYAQAIEIYGGKSTLEPSDAAVRGLVKIGRMLGW